jgi:ABC-type transport system involved in multi-copper enzyme maturation permease subunit
LSLKAGLALLKAEMGKVWARPILEITVALMAVMATYLVQPITQVVSHSDFSVTLQSVVAENVVSVVSSLMLPLIVMCAVLMSLSFARDYESGLMQSILSEPVSRKMLFTVKFFAVVLPLALLTWIFTTFFVGLTFYSSPWIVLQFSLFTLPVAFLFLTLCGSIGVLVALTVKRTIPAVLTAFLVNFALWYPSTIKTGIAFIEGASYANYLCLTPYKGALVFLEKLLGIVPKMLSDNGYALELSLNASDFGALQIVYVCILVIPLFVYFSRRFEICE